MSVLAQLGGTEMVPTALRVSAMGLASYGALTWISKHYGVEILQAAPHRILAAGVIAVASEFALRQFSSKKAMHLARLKASARALQKDLQDPKNRELTRGLLNEVLEKPIDTESMEALANGQLTTSTQEALAELKNDLDGVKEMMITLVSGPKRREPVVGGEPKTDTTPETEQEEKKREAQTIKEQRREIATLNARLEALEALVMKNNQESAAK